MRRRRVLVAALAATLLLAAATAPPAMAGDASTSAPTTSASPSPTADPTADPVDLRIAGAPSTALPPPTQRGTTAGFAFLVQGASPDATVTLTVPAGFAVAGVSAHNAPATCAPVAGADVCDIGAVDTSVTVGVSVVIPATTPIGAHLHLVATVTPVPGPDANPDDNTAAIDAIVSAHVHLTETGPDGPVLVAEPGQGTFFFRLHNSGPEPATGVKTRLVIVSRDTVPPTFAGFGVATVVSEGHARVWQVGTIPAGGTATLQVTLAATAPVRDSEVTWSTSYDDVGSLCLVGCPGGAKVVSFPSPSTGGGQPNPGSPQLAATGGPNGALGLLGAACVIAGMGVLVAARRRALHRR